MHLFLMMMILLLLILILMPPLVLMIMLPLILTKLLVMMRLLLFLLLLLIMTIIFYALFPVIDDVSYKDFRYIPQPNDHDRGGLEWKLLHYWIGSSRDIPGQKHTDAFPSPTMIGCAFAIDREFFYESGSYDAEMKIWGGENVEMAVRIWRCGGSLLKVEIVLKNDK